ncbi:glycosyltransferase family 4 protein [Conexibacter sp. SYSU D00693]|uniref:glycosyltransferase family 4 protein n=1 Tax=Conexibacter sp. SYSU D00693 TaxID=2812560 RepID=UPI00196A609D|nr:glycosyltransferase family 4 protein [Conexibacter sp. SYSU D00693]
MDVQLVDPSAFTPPYDRALAAALARAGADVVLHTSAFPYGEVPPAPGVDVRESFYRRSFGPAGGRVRRATKLLGHVPAMRRLARQTQDADVVHFQWLAVQHLDVGLLGRFAPPLVLTAHDVLPREPRPGQLDAQRRLYGEVDAVVVHSEHGRRRLIDEAGADPEKVHVIAHGAFEHLARTDPELPPELERSAARDAPVVLQLGLVRPYKGLDVLLDAWRGIRGAELWVVGMPRMDLRPLKQAAPPAVSFVDRFVTDAEVAAVLRRADLVVLPYREIDQSGVLFAALAFGKPIVASAVGGFPEVASDGAIELVPPGEPAALHAVLDRLLDDEAARARLAAAAGRAARTRFSWDAIARRHLDLYATLSR